MDVDVGRSTAPVVDGDLLADRAAAVVLVIGVLVEVDEVVTGVVFDDALPRRLPMEARVFGMTGQTAAHVADDRDLAHVHGIQACGNEQQQSDKARNEAGAGPLDVAGHRDAGDGGAEEQQDDGDDEPDHEGSFQKIRPFPRAGRLEAATQTIRCMRGKEVFKWVELQAGRAQRKRSSSRLRQALEMPMSHG